MELPFTPAVIREWGRCIGAFHRLARDFEPIYQRQSWREDENHQFGARIPIDQTIVRQRSKELMTRLSKLEESSNSRGLIHSDAHAGNTVADKGSLTFFDFDDCLTTCDYLVWTRCGDDIGGRRTLAMGAGYSAGDDKGRCCVSPHLYGRLQ